MPLICVDFQAFPCLTFILAFFSQHLLFPSPWGFASFSRKLHNSTPLTPSLYVPIQMQELDKRLIHLEAVAEAEVKATVVIRDRASRPFYHGARDILDSDMLTRLLGHSFDMDFWDIYAYVFIFWFCIYWSYIRTLILCVMYIHRSSNFVFWLHVLVLYSCLITVKWMVIFCGYLYFSLWRPKRGLSQLRTSKY